MCVIRISDKCRTVNPTIRKKTKFLSARYLSLVFDINSAIYVCVCVCVCVINGNKCKVCTATRCNESSLQQWKQNKSVRSEGDLVDISVNILICRVTCADSAG